MRRAQRALAGWHLSMPPSFLVLGFVLASIYGLVFFIFFGHGWWRLLFYWFVGVAGFFAGQGVASVLGLALFNIGDLSLVEGTVVSVASLVAVRVWRRG